MWRKATWLKEIRKSTSEYVLQTPTCFSYHSSARRCEISGRSGPVAPVVEIEIARRTTTNSFILYHIVDLYDSVKFQDKASHYEASQPLTPLGSP